MDITAHPTPPTATTTTSTRNMCRHITTVYLCGHRVIAPTRSTCANKAAHRSSILSYFRSGRAGSACPVCEVAAAAEVDKERRKTKEEGGGEQGGADPVLDWLQGIREAGAPGSRSGSVSGSGG